MHGIIASLEKWVGDAKPLAIATVISTWGSSPRGVGAKMVITSGGEMAGSVSGGCVEGAVVDAGVRVLGDGIPQLLNFGVTDDTAWEVGLACGGEIEIFIRRLNWSIFRKIIENLRSGRQLVNAVTIKGIKEELGEEILVFDDGTTYGDASHSHKSEVITIAKSALMRGEHGRNHLLVSEDSRREFFFDFIQPPPTLIIVGGVHIASPLSKIAKALGYRVLIIDPRRNFGSSERFPDVDQLFIEWPEKAFSQITIQKTTAIAILTHDNKIDDPSLEIVLTSPAFYIGVLGSKGTNAKRRQRLLTRGFSDNQLERIKAPIGLDLGGTSPEEIALAVMAEIVAAKNTSTQNLSKRTT